MSAPNTMKYGVSAAPPPAVRIASRRWASVMSANRAVPRSGVAGSSPQPVSRLVPMVNAVRRRDVLEAWWVMGVLLGRKVVAAGLRLSSGRATRAFAYLGGGEGST